jgi:hypothetical protein
MDGKDTGRRIDKSSRDAVCVLINECEFLLNNRFSLAKHMTKHRNRATLEVKDMHLLDKLEKKAHSNRLKTMRRHDRIEKAAALKSEKKSLLARKQQQQQQQIKKKKDKNKKVKKKKTTPLVINNASRKRKRTEKEVEIEKEDAIEPQLTKKTKINTINQNVVETSIDTESSSTSESSESSEYDEDADELRKIKERNNELLLCIEKEVEVEQEREDEEGAFCYEPLSTEY